ncbi:hypothetical protein BLOT_012600 [Blomia tropicalis]|nr:hypothetical protein BLOT_012600 [Blomia tropicalis]
MSKQVLKDLLETFEDDSTIVTDAGSVKSDKNKTKINVKNKQNGVKKAKKTSNTKEQKPIDSIVELYKTIKSVHVPEANVKNLKRKYFKNRDYDKIANNKKKSENTKSIFTDDDFKRILK